MNRVAIHLPFDGHLVAVTLGEAIVGAVAIVGSTAVMWLASLGMGVAP